MGGGDSNVQAKFYKLNKEYINSAGGNFVFVFLYANLFGLSTYVTESGIKDYNIVPAGTIMMHNNSLSDILHTMSFIPIKGRTMDTNQQFGDYMFANTIYDVGNMLGVNKEDIDKAFIEITEEEFYNFNPNKL